MGSDRQRYVYDLGKRKRRKREMNAYNTGADFANSSGSSLELESNTMKETENRGLDFRGKAEERERDVDGEMEEKDEVNQTEGHLTAALMLIKNLIARTAMSLAMASGRERDVVGELEGKLNQSEERVKETLMLIENCKECIGTISAMVSGRTQIQAPESGAKNLQLRLPSSLPDTFYTGDKAGGTLHPAIPVELIDKNTGHAVTSGPVSCAKLLVVAVQGNFDNEDNDDWTRKKFEKHVAMDRAGKKLLTGNLELSLKKGVGSLGELTFTDNTSRTPSTKIRLAVEVASGFFEGIRVLEGISNAFSVKERRGIGNKKHERPVPDDAVCRLKNIARDGKFHKRLVAAGISKVRHFLWILNKDRQRLEKILETKMPNAKWEALKEHARTCDLGGKYYVYYDENNKSTGVIFENIFELRGLTEGGVYSSAENLSEDQKYNADNLIREVCDNACCWWKNIEEYPGPMPSDMNPRKRARFSPADQQVRGPATGDPLVPFDQQVPIPCQRPSDPYFNPRQDFEAIDPLIRGDGPATSSDPTEAANGNTALPVEDHIFVPILEDDIVHLQSPHRYPSKQAGGIINSSGDEYLLATLPDHSNQADGTDEWSFQGFEAFTTDDEPFSDHSEQADGTIESRVETCKKHYPPASDDDVWRLDTISKNGHFGNKLKNAGISKVREFLWKLGRDSQGLWEILGTSMTSANWETLVKHARTCDLSGKYYVYYADTTKSSGVVFENIFELCGLIEGGVYYSAKYLSDSHKVSADTWLREACDNACKRWKHIEEYHMNPSKMACSSPTDVVTGAPESFDAGQQVPTPFRTPVASRVPAVGDPPVPFDQQVSVPGQPPSDPYFNRGQDFKGDVPATSSDRSEQAYESMDMAYEVPADLILDCMEDLGGLPCPAPSEQAGGNMSMGRGESSLETLSYHSEQADGTCDLSREYFESFMDFAPDGVPQPALDHSKLADGTNELSVEGEGERFPPTIRLTWADIQPWAEENCGIDQQDSTLFGTPVASRGQASVNQWPDVRDRPVPFDQQAAVPCQQYSGHFEDRYCMVGADIQGEL